MQKRPTRRARPAESIPTFPTATLPFVSASQHGRPHHWTVPSVGGPIRDYVEAEAIGRQYAVQFTQWLHANPELVGMGVLGWIASDIDFQSIDRSGYWVGFFSCIEGMLFDARAA